MSRTELPRDLLQSIKKMKIGDQMQ
jgi:hypothetical protein